MGWRFRKVIGSRGYRATITKKGVGFSWGIPGFHFGITPTGQYYLSFGIRGTGLYWIKYFGQPRGQMPR